MADAGGQRDFQEWLCLILRTNLISVSDLPSDVTRVVTVALSATAASTLPSGKRTHSSASVGVSLGCL